MAYSSSLPGGRGARGGHRVHSGGGAGSPLRRQTLPRLFASAEDWRRRLGG